ncbi:protein-tyrosine phosphatase-like protein [Apodospora peruviana]|uniref:Protein-tyrosine phosphatase-like protein n=1 Tax=Apodospora peruviana TaxID=516989 RepID=A0AAE0ITU7_9PEZI|nr:protein-tyrosine phosphatase-like protein [Apodospora peruviana]
MTLPSPPFITTIPSLANLRDIGGYPIANQPDKVVRRGILLRAAEPSKGDDAGAAILTGQLGVTHVFDLRSVQEVEKTNNEWDAGGRATRVFAPVFLDKDYSPEAMAIRFKDYSAGTEGFVRAYSTILASAADPTHEYAPFRTILEYLGTPTGPSPMLIHCTAGKDRTGVIVAIILSLCGVADHLIAHEYSLTDLGLAPRREAIIDHLIKTPALLGDRARAEIMVSSEKENMLETLKMLRQTYGSVEQYVIDHCQVSPEAVEQIKKNMVVDISAVEPLLDWESHANLLV